MSPATTAVQHHEHINCGLGDMGFILSLFVVFAIIMLANFIIAYKNVKWKRRSVTMINTVLSVPLIFTDFAILAFPVYISVIVVLATFIQLLWIWKSVQ